MDKGDRKNRFWVASGHVHQQYYQVQITPQVIHVAHFAQVMYLVGHKTCHLKFLFLDIIHPSRAVRLHDVFHFSLPLMVSYTSPSLLLTTQDLWCLEQLNDEAKKRNSFAVAIPGRGRRMDDKAEFWGQDPTSSSLALVNTWNEWRLKRKGGLGGQSFEHFKKENSNTDLIVSQGWRRDYDSESRKLEREWRERTGSSCVFVIQGDKLTELLYFNGLEFPLPFFFLACSIFFHNL